MTKKLKDSGERMEFSTGMHREPSTDKPRFDLCVLECLPYEEQLLTRFAVHMGRGASKYSERNFEKAQTQEELNRFKESAARHFNQRLNGLEDEDHASAVLFNMMGAEMVKYKLFTSKK